MTVLVPVAASVTAGPPEIETTVALVFPGSETVVLTMCAEAVTDDAAFVDEEAGCVDADFEDAWDQVKCGEEVLCEADDGWIDGWAEDVWANVAGTTVYSWPSNVVFWPWPEAAKVTAGPPETLTTVIVGPPLDSTISSVFTSLGLCSLNLSSAEFTASCSGSRF